MSIDHGRPFDFGRVSSDYAKYRDIYPQELYRRLRALEIGCQGQSVLDLGTGTGVLPRNLAPYGARFIGIDLSAEQIRPVSYTHLDVYKRQPGRRFSFKPADHLPDSKTRRKSG